MRLSNAESTENMPMKMPAGGKSSNFDALKGGYEFPVVALILLSVQEDTNSGAAQ
jgi:hypothetical protein